MTTEKLIESVRDIPTITRMSHVTQIEKIGELRDALIAAERAYTPTDDERATIIAELRWLAEAREKYQTDTFPSIAREVQTSRHLADILERKVPVAEGGAGFGWIPSWLWDEWDQMRQHAPEPQGEPSDAHLSNASINGVRQTWQQLYEREHEAYLELQGYRGMLSDLDRNAGGRHEGDYDSFVQGGISQGNPHLTTGDVIGYDIGGRAYVVPEPRDRGTLAAWIRPAGGVR